MKTLVRKLDAATDPRDVIREAATCLAEGGLVAFPTETVYGLGANAADPTAMRRLREVKVRDADKAFTVHIGSRSTVDRFVPEISGLGRRLISKAWPGPITVIFNVSDPERAAIVKETSPESVTSMYYHGTIGIRCPDDPVAAGLLNEAGVPVVAASANAAGLSPAYTADEVIEALDGQVDLVVDGGRSRYAKPSTIVRVNGSDCEILRVGVIDERTIKRLTQINFLVVCSGNTCRSPMAEGLLKSLLAEKLGCSVDELAGRGIHVESAGTGAWDGAQPSPQAVKVLAERGIDISAHRSRLLTVESLNRADYIYTMTRSHADTVTALLPDARERTRPVGETDIEDPIGGSEETYAQAMRSIEAALRLRLEEVSL